MFTSVLEQQLIIAVQGTLSKAANVNISLTNILPTSASSVTLILVVEFLDGNAAAAEQLLSNAQLAADVSPFCFSSQI